MGLFSKWTNKEGAKEAPADAKKQEAPEIKSAADTGRDRVEKISAAMKKSWGTFRSGAGRFGKLLLEGAANLGYKTLGGTEKGTMAVGRGIEKGVKAPFIYAGETAQEAGELSEKGIEKLNIWADDKVRKYEAAKLNLGIEFTETVDVLDNLGNGISDWTARKVAEYRTAKENLRTNIDNAPENAKAIWEGVKAQVIGAITEQLGQAQHRGRIEYSNARLEVGKSKDGFLGWVNNKRTEFAGTAELRGEVEALKEQVAKQNRLMEQLLRLQGARAEEPQVLIADEEDRVTEAGA